MSRLEFSDVARAAAGGWVEILQSLGVGAERLTNKHGPCPGCGGVDRFRFDDKEGRGTWVCSGGGADLLSGDGFDLLRHCFGWDKSQSLEEVAALIGLAPLGPDTPPARPAPAPAPHSKPASHSTQSYALSLWAAADRSDKAVGTHPYALAKGIWWHAGIGRERATGRVIGQNADCLIIPVKSLPELRVSAVQCINAEGKKQTFGPLKGHGFCCGNVLDSQAEWFVVEGWADAIAIFRHERNAVIFAAMGKQLEALAGAVRQAFEQCKTVTILGDADGKATRHNGVLAKYGAARAEGRSLTAEEKAEELEAWVAERGKRDPSIRIATLPMGPNGEKDASDHYQAGTLKDALAGAKNAV